MLCQTNKLHALYCRPNLPLQVRGNFALLLASKKDLASAEPMYRRVLKGFEESLGVNSPGTLANVTNLANLLKERQQYVEAEALYQRAITGYEAARGKRHEAYLDSLMNLAIFQKAVKKNYAEAEQLYRQALEGYKTVLGVDHPSTKKCASNLDFLLRAKSRPAGATCQAQPQAEASEV